LGGSNTGTIAGVVTPVGCGEFLSFDPWCRKRRNFEIEVDGRGGREMSIESKVQEIIVQQLGVDAGKVSAEASFVDDLGADSLDVVELVMAFEEEFDVEIPDEAAEKIGTVKDAVEFLTSNASS